MKAEDGGWIEVLSKKSCAKIRKDKKTEAKKSREKRKGKEYGGRSDCWCCN